MANRLSMEITVALEARGRRITAITFTFAGAQSLSCNKGSFRDRDASRI